MSLIRAHFDGENICLDDPVRLPKGAKLLVAIVDESQEKGTNRGLSAILRKASPWGPEDLSEKYHRYFNRIMDDGT